jgi:ribosomal protein S18 acetylase RimI-like enzyme
MTEVKPIDKLSSEEAVNVFRILCDVDKEFIPRLSERDSSAYRFNTALINELKPESYFKEIKAQKFILAFNKDVLVGFLTYKENFETTLNNDITYIGNYVTTIAISKKFRGEGVATKLYEQMIELSKDTTVYTRTWSKNYGHIKILKRLGFLLSHSIKNERGNGIDTNYFIKR